MCTLLLVGLGAACTLDSAGTGDVSSGVSEGGEGGAAGAGGSASGSGGSGEPSTGGVGGSGALGAAGGGGGQGGVGAQPPAPECGDGVVEAPEQCDDANAASNDGCSASCQVECPNGASVGPNLHCYWYLPEARSWSAASDTCASQNGHLVTLTTIEENGFIGTLVQTDVWIGATDGKPEGEAGVGSYGWITGEPFAYKAWASGEPNAASVWCGILQRCHEHCATLRPDGFWNDKYCERDELPAVCERTPPGLAPAP